MTLPAEPGQFVVPGDSQGTCPHPGLAAVSPLWMFLRLLAPCQEMKSLSSLTGLCHIQCLHGEVLFEWKAPAFVSTIGSVYLKNRMCSAPWKGWDVCRSQPLLQQALSRATMLSAGKKHIFGGFCKAFSVSMGACHGGCVSLALGVFIPASAGLSLHPHPLSEHGCFSIFQGWELPTPLKAREWFSAVTSESSSAFTALQMWQGHGAARNESPQWTRGHVFLKA